jgi:uncharacterized protein (TIGR00255 family)
MTGFGNARRDIPAGRLSVEMRSVNSRFLEVNVRFNQSLHSFEPEVRAGIRNRVRRGKVDVFVRFDPAEDRVAGARINLPLLKQLSAQLQQLNPLHEVTPESLLPVPGIVLSEAEPEWKEEVAADLMGALNEALDALAADRRREGEGLRAAFTDTLAIMRQLASTIDQARGDVVSRYRDRLLVRIEELLGPKSAALDPGRLEQEVAVFADRADISEECQRLAAHLDAFGDLIAKDDESVGRAMDFLCQEINREVNTLGSKCRDLDIARAVLELKQHVESLRENVANVE